MDSRDYLDAEGWPVIRYRDRLPLVWLLEGAAVSAGFERQLKACGYTKAEHRRYVEIVESRDSVAYALTLPSWWHYCHVRSFKCSNEPKRRGSVG